MECPAELKMSNVIFMIVHTICTFLTGLSDILSLTFFTCNQVYYMASDEI